MSLQQPPRTPPPRAYENSLLLTPPTPRYAPIDEPDLFARFDKKQKELHDNDTSTVLPLTPEQTPVNRKQADPSRLPNRSFLFEATASSTASPRKKANVRAPRVSKLDVFHEKPVPSSLWSGPSTKSHAPAVERPHPYAPLDTTGVPGMWHVFRGKKVFRPYANGTPSLQDYKPRVLFGPKRDDKSLEMSTTPIPKRARKEGPSTLLHMDDPFTTKLKQSVSKSMPARPSTPEIDSEEEETEREDDAPHVLSVNRHEFKQPSQRQFLR